MQVFLFIRDIPKGFQVDDRRSSVEDRSVHEYVRTGDHEDQRTSSLKGEGYRHRAYII